MQFTTVFTVLALLTSTAFAGALDRRQFDTGVASSDLNAQGNKGGNNGQANANKGVVKGHYTVSQAVASCGNAQLNCCNYIEQNDENGSGLIGAVLNVAGPIAVGCAPVNLLIASMDDACTKETVCCMGPSKPTQFGLVNVECTPIDVSVI